MSIRPSWLPVGEGRRGMVGDYLHRSQHGEQNGVARAFADFQLALSGKSRHWGFETEKVLPVSARVPAWGSRAKTAMVSVPWLATSNQCSLGSRAMWRGTVPPQELRRW